MKCRLSVVCGFLVIGTMTAARAAAPSALVTTEPVKTGSIKQTVAAFGTVEAAPGGTMTLSLTLPGIVERIEVTPGSTVQKGQTIAVIGADPSTMASYIQAKSAVSTATGKRDQVKTLLRNRLATRAQLDQANQAVVNAQSKLDALKREGAGQASRKVTAPFDGVVTAVPAAQGPILQAGTPLAVLARSADLIAKVGLDPAMLARVRIGDPATVTETAGGSGAQHGKVIRLGGVANSKSGLVDASISLPAGRFLIGQVVSAGIITGTVHGVMVPRDAALPQGRHAVLYQVANGHAQAVKVQILGSAHGKDVVSGKIDPHLPIVTSGNYQLKPGMAVREQAKP